MFYDKNLVTQIYSLKRLTRLNRLRTAIEHLIRDHGFQHFFFVLNGAVSTQCHESLTIHDLPDTLCQLYEDEHLNQGDPLVHYGMHQALPLDWPSIMELPEYDTVEQRGVMMLRHHHGMTGGCVVPLHANSLHGLLILVAREETAQEHVRQFLPYALLLGQVVMERTRVFRQELQAENVEKEASSVGTQNSRDRECLVWASEGNTNKEIGKRLGITERTVVYHLGNACRKLRARNRQHAVTRAILTRQIPLEGLDGSE